MCLGMANGGKSLTAKEAIENVQKAGVELTKNMIVSALEYCTEPRGKRNCEKCHYFFSDIKCKTHLMIDVLDLINRQQAEIEKLKKENKIVDLNRRMALLEKQPLYDKIKTIKAEAIKEFADRLKKHLKGNGGLFCVTTMNAQIDNLAKEMVGEENDT